MSIFDDDGSPRLSCGCRSNAGCRCAPISNKHACSQCHGVGGHTRSCMFRAKGEEYIPTAIDGKCLGCGTEAPKQTGPQSALCPACAVDPKMREKVKKIVDVDILKERADVAFAQTASVALRKNEGKIRYDLIPVEWEEQLAKLLTAGCLKYTDRNWEKSVGKPESTEWRQKCYASARRHIAAWQRGEMTDPEHKESIHHLTAAAWNFLAIVFYDIREGKMTNEPK